MKLSIMKVGFLIFPLLFLFIISCSDSEKVIPALGVDYFPLRTGDYAIYEVDETTILSSVKTVISYDLKVTVTDSSVNNQGEVTYILLREKRTMASGNWGNLDTWSARIVNNKAIQNEGNVTFVKLMFPPALNLNWDGNEYNNLVNNGELFYDGDNTPYFISEWVQPITLSTGFSSDNSLTVVQNDYNDPITGIDERKEIYAREVGLIYKEINQFVKCNGSACAGDKSYIFTQILKEHGKI